MVADEILPIENMGELKEYMDEGYELEGPRKNREKDLIAIERFFAKGHVFFPEGCLTSRGCQLVPSSPLTKGLELAYKTEGEDMSRWHRSQYTLVKGDIRIPLYLSSPEH